MRQPGETAFVYCLDPRQGCLYEARFSPGTPDTVITAAIGAALVPAWSRPGRDQAGRRPTEHAKGSVNRDDDR